ncbi:hypothetical protein MHYP_G00078570 [Metynnis hypsauchen]
MARFPSVSLPVQKRWRAKSAMHYPAITAAIYIPPSITDTYYSPPAVQRAAPAPTRNFLKAAPYILIRQQLLCKCGSKGEDSENSPGFGLLTADFRRIWQPPAATCPQCEGTGMELRHSQSWRPSGSVYQHCQTSQNSKQHLPSHYNTQKTTKRHHFTVLTERQRIMNHSGSTVRADRHFPGFYEFHYTPEAAMLMALALAHYHGNLEEVISNSVGASAQPIKAPESRGASLARPLLPPGPE